MDAQGLQRRYRDILLGRVDQADTIQLGLIELARRGARPLRLEEEQRTGGAFMVLEAII
jgi:hypothetical protein